MDVVYTDMARVRKRHIQQELVFRTHGGNRKGAGRPPRHKRSCEPHKCRPTHDRRHPIHVTIRVVSEVGRLRRRDIYMAVREATITTAKREDFHLVHFSVQGNHLHLLIEALHKQALWRGMQGFQISAAKHINAAITTRTGVRRRGQVFADRYHARPLTTPRQVRDTIAYVLNNWRRHGEDRAGFTKMWKVDPFSTGVDFGGWKELGDSPFLYKHPPTYQGMVVWLPKTWLLRESWSRYGPISVHEVPGPQH